MHNTISVKLLKKGAYYILTDDFYPFGGKRVRLIRHGKGKEPAIVRDDEGEYYAVSMKAWLFTTEGESN